MPDLRDGLNPAKGAPYVEYPGGEKEDDPNSWGQKEMPPWEKLTPESPVGSNRILMGKPSGIKTNEPVDFVPPEALGMQEDRRNPVLLPDDPWRHRAIHMRCRNCMWYAEKVPSFGRCRRHAPTMSGYPAVYSTDWCGDHKMNEETL
jgi:hypothetical protein